MTQQALLLDTVPVTPTVTALPSDAIGRVLALIPRTHTAKGRHAPRPDWYLYRWVDGGADSTRDTATIRFATPYPGEPAWYRINGETSNALREHFGDARRRWRTRWTGTSPDTHPWILAPRRAVDPATLAVRPWLTDEVSRRARRLRCKASGLGVMARSIHALVLWFHWGAWLGGRQTIEAPEIRRLVRAGLPITALSLATRVEPGSDAWTVEVDRLLELGHPHGLELARRSRDPVIVEALRWYAETVRSESERNESWA